MRTEKMSPARRPSHHPELGSLRPMRAPAGRLDNRSARPDSPPARDFLARPDPTSTWKPCDNSANWARRPTKRAAISGLIPPPRHTPRWIARCRGVGRMGRRRLRMAPPRFSPGLNPEGSLIRSRVVERQRYPRISFKTRNDPGQGSQNHVLAQFNLNSEVVGDEMAQDAEPRCLEEGRAVLSNTVSA